MHTLTTVPIIIIIYTRNFTRVCVFVLVCSQKKHTRASRVSYARCLSRCRRTHRHSPLACVSLIPRRQRFLLEKNLFCAYYSSVFSNAIAIGVNKFILGGTRTQLRQKFIDTLLKKKKKPNWNIIICVNFQ